MIHEANLYNRVRFTVLKMLRCFHVELYFCLQDELNIKLDHKAEIVQNLNGNAGIYTLYL